MSGSQVWGAIKSKNEDERLEGARALQRFVHHETRDMPSEARAEYLNRVNDRILALVNSPDLSAKAGGIVAMEHLIDIFLAQNMEAKIIQFASSLRTVLEKSSDVATLTSASKALGNLTRQGGTTLIELVEQNIIKTSFGWLQAESSSSRKLAAVLVLKELAANNATLFYLYAPQFFDKIWYALNDATPKTREAAAGALRASLLLLDGRDSKHRQQWHNKLFKGGKLLI